MNDKKFIFLLGIFLFSLLFTRCNNSDSTYKEQELKQKEIALKQRELIIQEQEQNNRTKTQPAEASLTKFIYVVIKTYEPRIEIKEEDVEILPTPDGYYESTHTETKRVKYIIPQDYSYTSDIVEISNYSEDKQYAEVDRYEDKINSKINQVNKQNDFDDIWKKGNYVKIEAILSSKVAKIRSKNSYVFNTYKEASIDRDTNK